MVSRKENSANSCFVSTGSGIVVFDTGSSFEEGHELRSEIEKISEEPILYVVNSHGHVNHCGGKRSFHRYSFSCPPE